jgi:hypothetical protein
VRTGRLLLTGLTQLVGQVQAGTGLDQVADQQADPERGGRHHQEVTERQTADLADTGGLADRADAEHQRAEDDRADHHLDQVDEPGAERFQLDREVREQETDTDAEQYGDDDGDVEEVGAVVADGRRSGFGRARHGGDSCIGRRAVPSNCDVTHRGTAHFVHIVRQTEPVTPLECTNPLILCRLSA